MIPVVMVLFPFVAMLGISLAYALVSAIFGMELFDYVGWSVYQLAGGTRPP